MNNNDKLWILLSPPGVFGGVETGQVFVFFDDIHLFTGPRDRGAEGKNDRRPKSSHITCI